jgi:beta-fructofuranosidase
MRALVVVSFASACLLLLLQLAGASHVVYNYKDLEAEAAAATDQVPPSIVNPLLRTGYHFQPPKNWINGNVKLLTNPPPNVV